MANTLKISVDNPDELLLAGVYGAGALIRIQSSATESGAYANLSGTGSTPTIALVAGTFIYTGQDPNGTSSTWYKTRYENSGGTLTSDYSAAFQVSAEGSGLLASVYDAKQRLGIVYTDTGQDENLIEWLTQITGFIHAYCGRTFTPDGATSYIVNTTFARRLWLPRGVRTISALGVASEDQPASGGTYTTASATSYYIGPPEWERTPGWPGTYVEFSTSSGLCFYDAANGAQITGTFGFASIPADIRNVALNLLVAYARERGAGGGDSITIGIGGERTYERALSSTDRMTLDRYRIRHVS